MEIRQLSLLNGAKQARGLAVIIDVFRAFSVAAYAFDKGARDIALVGEAWQAFMLRHQYPDAILMGEVGGKHIEGFDFDNSPTHIIESARNFRDCRCIQRTSAGTQGVVNANDADEIVLGNIVCAQAIVDYIQARNPDVVTIVEMGESGMARNDEDTACSDLLAARLRGESVDEVELLARARNGRAAQRFLENHPDAPSTDVDYCLQLDKFYFVMCVAREDGMLVARRQRTTATTDTALIQRRRING